MSATLPAGVRRVICRQAVVVASERLPAGSFRLAVRVDGDLPEALPGQFAMLSLDQPGFPILPRPFCLLGWRSDERGAEAEFLVMPVGKGSAMLCALRPGQELRLVVPLGQPLDVDPPVGAARDLLCVGGGYGIAPFLFLAERLAQREPGRRAATTVIYGARRAAGLALHERLAASGVRLILATDDGSAGRRGRVDGVLADELATGRFGLVLTCGPEPMMEAVGAVAAAAGVCAQASLETVMGCGIAVCNGCAVAVEDDADGSGLGYELACREGTIFDTDRLLWSLH